MAVFFCIYVTYSFFLVCTGPARDFVLPAGAAAYHYCGLVRSLILAILRVLYLVWYNSSRVRVPNTRYQVPQRYLVVIISNINSIATFECRPLGATDLPR